MQIAIRDDQPRFETGGAQRAGRPAGGHPFDELVRAMSARDTRDAPVKAGDDLPVRERRRPRADDRSDERPEAEKAERPRRRTAESPAGAAPMQAAETQPMPEAPPTLTTTTPAAGPVAAAEGQATTTSTSPSPSPQQPGSATGPSAVVDGADPAVGSSRQAGAALAAAGPAAPQPFGKEGLLVQLNAMLQAGNPLAETLAAPVKAAATAVAPGLSLALMAQALASPAQGSPATITPTTAPGQRVLAAQAPGKAASRQSDGGPAAQNAAGGQLPDFRAIVAALAGGAKPAEAAAAGAATAAADGLEGTAPSGAGAAGSATATAAPHGGGDRAGHAARAEAPPPAHQPPRLNGPQFAERVGLTIVRAVEAGVDRVSIRLNPVELGRIDVRMELGQDGRMTLTVAADRQETLDQLQRNVRDLERSLADAGFDTGAGDLNFSLRHHNPSGDHDPGRRDGGADGRGPGVEAQDAAEAEDGIIITHNSGSHMVVDLFV